MNIPCQKKRLVAAAMAFASLLSVSYAAENILWSWDTARGSWGTAWGQAVTELDLAMDNTGNNGGSLHISSDFTGTPPDDNRNVITVMGNYGGWLWNGDVRTNLLDYTHLEFDLRWDSARSTLSIANFNDSGGDNGLVIWSARYTTDWQWGVELGRITIPEEAANGWVRISVPIDPKTPDLDESAGVVFKKWVPQETADAGGVAAFWIDNLELIASEVPIEPPTLSINMDVKTGLNLITLAGSEWQRQGIRTVGTNYSWVGSPTPATYEFTVSEMPDTNYAGFHTHIFLAPNDTRAGTGVDWTLPDIVRFEMSLQADGSGLATLRYKTDSPDSNGTMYGGDGQLASVTNPTALGRWGFTFNDEVNVTIFSPTMTTNVLFPAAATTKFDAPLTVYLGCMPNAPARVGQKAVLAQAKVQGVVGGQDLSDDFSGPLNPSLWELAAENPSGVMILTDDAACWLGWSLPDTGFGLQAATDLMTTDWSLFAGATAPLPTGPTKTVLVNKSGLPDSHQNYWRLKGRAFTKLQVLLPGETAAPGTATGKTGTPNPQILYSNFDVIINAVSDDWTLMRNVTDTVTFSSTDQDILAEDVVLVNGTATAVMNMGNAGTHTITASDVTNPSIVPGTSSQFMVNPL
jgi:hypothetical protein